jgi:RHS repeat-associated protein
VGTGVRTQTASFDVYGNITALTTNGSVQSTPTDPTTNRLQSPLASYDGGGNVTVLNYGSERYEYTYDGTNMMKYLASDTGLARTFLYTAGDERAVQLDCETAGCGVDDATHTWTLRGTGAESLRIYTYRPGREWEWSKDYVHRNGKSVAAVSAGGVSHLHPDHLGTPRQITRSGGGQESLHSYYPFGQEATGAAQDDIVLKFTGHERDSNDGRSKGALDYMHARFCSPGLGRFLNVDPLGIRFTSKNPQRWNRYALASNNPLKYIDPDGKEIELASQSLRTFLVNTLTRPSGRALLTRLGKSSLKVVFQEERRNSDAVIIAARRGLLRDQSVRFEAIGDIRSASDNQRIGVTVGIDPVAVRSAHPTDKSGVTTTAHGAHHAEAAIGGMGLEEVRATGDFPSSEQGAAEKFGQEVAAEEPDITEEEASRMLDELLAKPPPE